MIWHINHILMLFFNEGVNLQEIVRLLHPYPAVCGFPKEESKFILEEQYDRSILHWFLGELNQAMKMEC
jgi:isochorismate synthase